MPDEHAVLARDERGRSVLRFERLLSHPPEKVWRALTEQGALDAWHPTPFDLDPTVGGEVRYASNEGDRGLPAGRVLPTSALYCWPTRGARMSCAGAFGSTGKAVC
jgi:hypothetical protein